MWSLREREIKYDCQNSAGGGEQKTVTQAHRECSQHSVELVEFELSLGHPEGNDLVSGEKFRAEIDIREQQLLGGK